MIKHEIFEKPLEYVFLAALFILSLIAYIIVPLNIHQRRWFISFVAVGYFIWSLYHHYRRGDLHPSIIIEYLLILFLGIVFISTTLF